MAEQERTFGLLGKGQKWHIFPRGNTSIALCKIGGYWVERIVIGADSKVNTKYICKNCLRYEGRKIDG